MNSDEFYEYEDRAYIQPTLSSGEQEKFISNLRDLQTKNNAQIAQQTYNLGTAVPSNLGGLGGGEAYFTSRYQVPQVNEMVNTLKAAAQAQALNDVVNNYKAQLQNQYSQAYRSAQKRARARQNAYYNSLLGGGGNGTGDGTGGGLDITTNGGKSGGFWDTWLGSSVADFTTNALSGGKVNVNTGGTNAATYEGAPMSLKAVTGGGSSSLGLWPDGTRMTEGSTYKWGGDTYTVKSGISGNKYDIVKVN